MQNFTDIIREGIRCGRVYRDEPMKLHTTFQVGGPADLFVEPAGPEELSFLIRTARDQKVPYFIVGKGSNLLVSDRGYRGMIIHIGRLFQDLKIRGDRLCVRAGSSLARAAREALDAGLSGLEFAAGIPGSVGGAAAMNAGAYGSEIRDVLLFAEVMTEDGEILKRTPKELDLSYRHSCVFEKNYIVLSAEFLLAPGDRTAIKARMDELARARKSKQPLEYPSAGSTFKRPEGHYAGKLIQEAGLKGCSVGDAQVSEKHSGFVINRGNATAADVMELIRQVQDRVYAMSGLVLHPEVRFVGFDETEVVR